MKRKRLEYACSEIRDKEGRVVTIVVAGGWDPNFQAQDSVEILTLATMTFQDGTNLPVGIAFHSLTTASTQEAVYLIGGWPSDSGAALSSIYMWDLNNTHEWKLIGNIKKKRYLHVALSIPNNLVPEGC